MRLRSAVNCRESAIKISYMYLFVKIFNLYIFCYYIYKKL